MIIINNVMLSYLLFIVDANDALTTSFIFIGVTHLLLPLNDFVGESIRYTHTHTHYRIIKALYDSMQQQYSSSTAWGIKIVTAYLLRARIRYTQTPIE